MPQESSSVFGDCRLDPEITKAPASKGMRTAARSTECFVLRQNAIPADSRGDLAQSLDPSHEKDAAR
jgi:hypothetical protein